MMFSSNAARFSFWKEKNVMKICLSVLFILLAKALMKLFTSGLGSLLKPWPTKQTGKIQSYLIKRGGVSEHGIGRSIRHGYSYLKSKHITC